MIAMICTVQYRNNNKSAHTSFDVISSNFLG